MTIIVVKQQHIWEISYVSLYEIKRGNHYDYGFIGSFYFHSSIIYKSAISSIIHIFLTILIMSTIIIQVD